MEERSDVDIGAIAKFGGVLVIAAAVIHVLIWALFVWFDHREAAGDKPPLAVAGELPPEPRLRTSPRDDMKKLREEENERLTTYGWVDKNAGVARIPIERAIDITAEKGLPAREGPK